MYEYIKGKITIIEPTYIVLENNLIGYLVTVSNPYQFDINADITLYLYQYVREDMIQLFGFKTKDEKKMFLKLISVTGIGPKSALSILASMQIDEFINAIESGNAKYLTKYPGIGLKTAQQIILDLKGKLVLNNEITIKNQVKEDLEQALLNLGYKKQEINKAINKLDFNNNIDVLLKQALQNMLK